MSSGRFTSSLFSCSFFRTHSSVLSTGGLGTFSCAGFFSSCEPKLFGRVLLRWRVRGGKSSSDFSSLCSGERINVDWWTGLGWEDWGMEGYNEEKSSYLSALCGAWTARSPNVAPRDLRLCRCATAAGIRKKLLMIEGITVQSSWSIQCFFCHKI